MRKCKDSALGEHSADFGGLEATADLKSSSAPKPPKNYESPTATPRILEEENQFESKAQAALESKRLDSSTAQNLKPAKPSCLKIQSIQSGLDASF